MIALAEVEQHQCSERTVATLVALAGPGTAFGADERGRSGAEGDFGVGSNPTHYHPLTPIGTVGLIADALPTRGELENNYRPTTYEAATAIGVAAAPSKRAFFAGGLPRIGIFVVCWESELAWSLRALTTTPHRGRGRCN